MDEDQFLHYFNLDFPDFQMSKNDLINPTCQFLKRYYVNLIGAISRISASKLCNYTDDQVRFLQSCGEGHEFVTHVSNYNLYCAIKFIFENTDTMKHEFHYSDLLFPALSPKRSYVFMNLMYRFYTGCGEFDEAFEQLDSLSSKASELKTLKDEIEDLKMQLSKKAQDKLDRIERSKEIHMKLAEYAAVNAETEMMLKKMHEQELEEVAKLNELQAVEQKEQEALAKLDNQRKYFESLVVSDEQQIIEHHGKLLSAKDECLVKVQRLEAKLQEVSSKCSKYDKILNLQESLNASLQEKHAVGSEAFGLKDLYLNSCALSLKNQELVKLEAELLQQIKEKEETMPSNKILCAKLDAEKNAMQCTWAEKKRKYEILTADLKNSIAKLPPKEEIESQIDSMSKSMQEMQIRYGEVAAEVKMMHEQFVKEFERYASGLETFVKNTKTSADSFNGDSI